MSEEIYFKWLCLGINYECHDIKISLWYTGGPVTIFYHVPWFAACFLGNYNFHTQTRLTNKHKYSHLFTESLTKITTDRWLILTYFQVWRQKSEKECLYKGSNCWTLFCFNKIDSVPNICTLCIHRRPTYCRESLPYSVNIPSHQVVHDFIHTLCIPIHTRDTCYHWKIGG